MVGHQLLVGLGRAWSGSVGLGRAQSSLVGLGWAWSGTEGFAWKGWNFFLMILEFPFTIGENDPFIFVETSEVFNLV